MLFNPLRWSTGQSTGQLIDYRVDYLVERFFGDLTAFITEQSFTSTRELADAIITFLAARNDNPRRYVWKAKGEDILRKIDAARRALVASQVERSRPSSPSLELTA